MGEEEKKESADCGDIMGIKAKQRLIKQLEKDIGFDLSMQPYWIAKRCYLMVFYGFRFNPIVEKETIDFLAFNFLK